MQFEFDPAKSAANKAKHGIDFDEAKALWQDERAIEAPAKYHNELRYMAIGRIEGRSWTAVFTLRNEKIRLISVRRSRQQEIELYEEGNESDERS